jgi:hypothetical protein
MSHHHQYQYPIEAMASMPCNNRIVKGASSDALHAAGRLICSSWSYKKKLKQMMMAAAATAVGIRHDLAQQLRRQCGDDTNDAMQLISTSNQPVGGL